MKLVLPVVFIGSLLFLFSCQREPVVNNTLFELLDNETIGVNFSNNLTSTKQFNVYKYRNFYNGGGVAIGDINNDGFQDVYMVSNQGKNHLYLNKGNMTFEEIAESAGVTGDRSWSTGVSLVDIDADGDLDIYLCNSGDVAGDNKENELFINNGNLTFTESAESYNLNDKGYSTHASFFDYDQDGDLDIYLLNNSFQAIGSFNLRKNERPVRDELGGDKLMENQNGKFVDVSEAAGIYGSVIGFGLGVTVSDFNSDGWLDIFVSNDFFERDYLYINNGDKTFTEDLEAQMSSISAASMGADAVDINNDGHSDLFVTDMLPSEYERLKTVTTFDDWNRYQYNLKNGYHHQFTRNVLQRNNGNGTFSEISRLAGVEASDWSWGALFFDMDNDGFKDLFIANGIYKDLTNQDYLQYIANEQVIKSVITDDGVNYKELIDTIPSNMVVNHAYRNAGGLSFDPWTDSGLQAPSFSNGSAYGDLDNDGDLDLVVNNVNMPSFFYENKLDQSKQNYIKLVLKGDNKNTYAVGATISIQAANGDQYSYENVPTRGFQSSMDPRPNIGIGHHDDVDIEVSWPSGKITQQKTVKANQTIVLQESDALEINESSDDFNQVFSVAEAPIEYVKEENNYVDFNRERLIYHMRSNEGGEIIKADLNGDEKDDLILPGAKGIVSEIYLSARGSNHIKSNQESLEKLKESEHISAAVLDAEGDGDLDIYFVSGGVELSEYSEYMYDHLMINDGEGNFSLSTQRLPSDGLKISSSTVSVADIDGDGDYDLFVGERIKIGKFGARTSGYILVNDGKGNFDNKTSDIAPDLNEIGMITDSDFSDIDGDGDDDLLIVGEFMDISLFTNEGGKLQKTNLDANIPLRGWWNSLQVVDVNQDGRLDIIAGNLGSNSRFEASKDKPIRLYYADFDNNRFPEGIMTFRADDGKYYPYSLRHNLIDQIKILKKKFPDFESFKTADITQIFTKEQLDQAQVSEVNQLQTVVLINEGSNKFTAIELPEEAQFSPMYASEVFDFDNDGDQDIVLGGNLYNVVPEMGIYDGSYGCFLENKDGQYYAPQDGSGLSLKGEIRDFTIIDNQLIVLSSRDSLRAFRF